MNVLGLPVAEASSSPWWLHRFSWRPAPQQDLPGCHGAAVGPLGLGVSAAWLLHSAGHLWVTQLNLLCALMVTQICTHVTCAIFKEAHLLYVLSCSCHLLGTSSSYSPSSSVPLVAAAQPEWGNPPQVLGWPK